MVVSHFGANMHWETKAQFFGQVKPAGIEKGMNWKMGSVHFDYDAGSGSWMANLYFKVNPTKSCQQIKIGQSSNLDVKCGRLMIENQKGDGIHIKLSNSDVTNARMLITKIKSSKAATPTINRAEVGIVSSSTMSKHKGSENVSPVRGRDSDDLSLFQTNGNISPERQSLGWLSRKTPPMKNRELNPTPKRKLELFSPERERGKNIVEEDKLSSTTSFTGMKDYSKRNLNGGNSLSVTSGLGPRSFYGSQNSLTASSDCRNISANNSRGLDRSPVPKRPKLSSSLNCKSNRMEDSIICDTSSLAAEETEDGTISRRSSGSHRRHFRAGETVGFQNLGNTCFLNSPLQCLSSLEPLSLDIQSAIALYGAELNPNSMTRKLYLLMKDVRKRDVCPEHVKEILRTLRMDMNIKFAPNTQQDAHEFLSEVLNRVDEEVKAAMRLHASARSIQATLDSADVATPLSEEDQTASPSNEGARDEATPLLSPNSICTPIETNFCWSYRTDIFFHDCKTQVLASQTEREMTLMLAFDASTKSLQDCINKYFESTEVEMKCEACGKEEKATISRKIVRRPRVLILNLLRYHSDNTESTKKADTVCVPSYISISGYCTEDVKKPPCVDPVFMMDRMGTRSPLKTRKSRVISGGSEEEDVDEDSFYTPRSKRESSGAVRPDSLSSNQMMDRAGPCLEDSELSVLADFVKFNLRSIQDYVGDSQDSGNYIAGLRDRAQILISELNETIITQADQDRVPPGVRQSHERTRRFSTVEFRHEISLSVALLKRAFSLDDSQWVHVLENALKQVVETVVCILYEETYSQERGIDYLIEDLGMYVSAMESGLMKSIRHEQGVIIDRLRVISERIMAQQSVPQVIRPVESLYDDAGGEHSGESYIQEETIPPKKVVSFKKEVKFIKNDLDDSNSNQVGIRQNERTDQHEKYCSPVKVERLWKDDWEGGDHSSQKQSSSEGTSSRTRYLYSPAMSSQSIHDKDISMYSEAELQKVDYNSLTEDEMMVYAQALSRFEYEKERTTLVENESPDIDVMDVCNSGQNSEDGSQDALEIIDLTSNCEGFSQKQLEASNEEIVVEDDSPKTTTSNKLASSKALPVYEQDETASLESDLICQEDLSGLDETDGRGTHAAVYVEIPQSSVASLAVKPHLILDSENASPSRCSISGDSSSTAGGSDQAHSDSPPIDSDLQTDTLLPDLLSELSPPKDLACNTSPSLAKSEDSSEQSAESDSVDDGAASKIHSSLRSPVKRTAKESVDKNGDDFASTSSHSPSKKEYLFPPSKTSNLVRTRDYARLKSPGVSPKKRVAKGQQAKSVSVTTWLQFSGEDKVKKNLKTSPDGDESLSGEDCSSSEMLDTSLEVNVDDASFLDNINNSSFVNPSVLAISHSTCFSTPKSKPAPKCAVNDTDLPQPVVSAKAGVVPSSDPSTLEEPSLQQQTPQTNQRSDMQVDQFDTFVRVKKIVASEPMQENIEPDSSAGGRVRINRPVIHAEEKENMPKDVARGSRGQNIEVQQNIEMGKADLSYKLVGVVDHTGTSQFTGHYTAYAFNMKKQKWFHLNDSETEVVTEEEVQENNTQTGYLFFYMDKDLFNEYRDTTNAMASNVKPPS